jgi:hypothetical protein
MLVALGSISALNRHHDRIGVWVSLSLATLLAALGAVFGLAWWSNWKRWVSARKWAMAASVLGLSIFMGIPGWQYFAIGRVAFLRAERLLWLPTVIGLGVLVVFSLPSQRPSGPHVARTLDDARK